MTPADVLDAAADLLERDGWCQGNHRHAAGTCVDYALHAATQPVHNTARQALQRRVGPVAEWNNAPDQTAANVIATMRSVAADLRGQPT